MNNSEDYFYFNEANIYAIRASSNNVFLCIPKDENKKRKQQLNNINKIGEAKRLDKYKNKSNKK